MAAEGVRFTQFYAGSTVCAPSRSVLMTGLHLGPHARARQRAAPSNPAAQTLRAGDVTVARVLQQAGYATALDRQVGPGRDRVGGRAEPARIRLVLRLRQPDARAQPLSRLPLAQRREGRAAQRRRRPSARRPGPATRPRACSTPTTSSSTRRATFIDRSKDRPFFLYLSLTVPHANNERARALGDGQEVPDYGPYADEGLGRPAQGPGRDDHAHGPAHRRAAGAVEAARPRRPDRSSSSPATTARTRKAARRTTPTSSTRTARSAASSGASPTAASACRSSRAGRARSAPDAPRPHVGYFGDLMATFARAGRRPGARRRSTASASCRRCSGRGTQARHDVPLLGVLRGRLQPGRAARRALEGHPPEVARRRRSSCSTSSNDPAEQTDLAARQPALVARIAAIMRDAHVDNEHWKWPAAK